MALSVDDAASGSNSLASTVTASVTSVVAGSIICVFTFGAKGGGCPVVSGVTAAGLTFARRQRDTTTTIGGVELWWASAATPGACAVTVSYAAAFDVACINVLAVSGANPAAPWDTDASLPAVYAQNSPATPSFTISTASANDLLLIGFGMASNWANWESSPPGFTLQVACSDSGADYPAELTTMARTVSARQSSAAIVWTAPPSGVGSFGTEAVLDALVAAAAGPSPDPDAAEADGTMVFLSWSDDRGHSFGNPVGISLGEAGEYLTSLQWQRLGLARDMVFCLQWSAPVRTVLLGAWIDATPAYS